MVKLESLHFERGVEIAAVKHQRAGHELQFASVRETLSTPQNSARHLPPNPSYDCNWLSAAVILSSGAVLRVSHQELRTGVAPGHNADQVQTLEEVGRNHILRTLKEPRRTKCREVSVRRSRLPAIHAIQ